MANLSLRFYSEIQMNVNESFASTIRIKKMFVFLGIVNGWRY